MCEGGQHDAVPGVLPAVRMGDEMLNTFYLIEVIELCWGRNAVAPANVMKCSMWMLPERLEKVVLVLVNANKFCDNKILE